MVDSDLASSITVLGKLPHKHEINFYTSLPGNQLTRNPQVAEFISRGDVLSTDVWIHTVSAMVQICSIQ